MPLDSGNILAIIKQATASWLSWSSVDIQQRFDLIKKWSELLSQQRNLDLMPSQMVNFHNQQALALIGEPQLMPGPTGESNVLTGLGRGVFVVMADDNVPETVFVALVCCALISGNSLIIASHPKFQEIIESLTFVFSLSVIDEPVVQIVEKENIERIVSTPCIAGMAYAGNQAEAIRLNSLLAKREGQIAQFITETDLNGLETVRDQCLVLRFITEKTQTINVTAVGGNASLLALGSGDL
jgi:delta 1-pyrroline-5-carboxylate dehydrogenase